MTPAHVERILETALLAYDAVVVDAGSTLDERSLAALERAEVVVLPVYPEISALKAVHSFLDYVNEAGSISAKTTFVLNSMFAKEVLKMRDVEAGSGRRSSLTLPYDPFLYLKAVNEGNPVVLGAARTPVAAALHEPRSARLRRARDSGPHDQRGAQVARPRRPAQADLRPSWPGRAGRAAGSTSTIRDHSRSARPVRSASARAVPSAAHSGRDRRVGSAAQASLSSVPHCGGSRKTVR